MQSWWHYVHNMLVKKNITCREAKRMAKNGVWWRSMDDTRGFLAGARIVLSVNLVPQTNGRKECATLILQTTI